MLGTLAVHFGRRFRTKVGGVLVQKKRVSGRGRWGQEAGQQQQQEQQIEECSIFPFFS